MPVTVAVRSETWVLPAWLLGSWVRIPLGWMFVLVFLCCVVLYDWEKQTERGGGGEGKESG
jgi:hypothetical protein